MIPTLRTERLALRPPRPDDAAAIAAFLNDFAVSGNLARVPFPYHLSDAKAWLATQRMDMPPGETGFAIDLAGTGYVGHIGFHTTPAGPVIGYWLGHPFWNRGLMTEAAIAAIDWFFEEANFPVLRSGVFHFNAASLALQHRLGFVETGRSHLLCLARGAEVEHIDTQLTLSVWKARRQ